jgi:hypothetical protein
MAAPQPPQGPPAYQGPPPYEGPPTSPWPAGWGPAWTPKPPVRVNWLTLLGGVLVFIGYILFALADFSFALLDVNAPYAQFLAIAMIYVTAEIIIGSGFLLAFYSLAVHRG